MRKTRYGLLAVVLAAVLWAMSGPGARAGTCDTNPNHSSNPTWRSPDLDPGDGDRYVYANGDPTTVPPNPSTSGYVGITGSTGYIEANGSASGGGYIQGSTTDDTVSGQVHVPPSGAGDVCVDTPAN